MQEGDWLQILSAFYGCFTKHSAYLQDGEIFQYTVHHVFFGELFELVYEVDHVLTHWRSVDSVDKPIVFIVAKFGLQENSRQYNYLLDTLIQFIFKGNLVVVNPLRPKAIGPVYMEVEYVTRLGVVGLCHNTLPLAEALQH